VFRTWLVLDMSRTRVGYCSSPSQSQSEVCNSLCPRSHPFSLQDCPEPSILPPSKKARQGAYPVSPHPSWDFGDLSSSGASAENTRQGRRHRGSKSDGCSANRQENCSDLPGRCMDQHSHPATGLGIASASHTPDAAGQRHQALPFLGIGTPLPATEINATEQRFRLREKRPAAED
jgi:hypothetical protein